MTFIKSLGFLRLCLISLAIINVLLRPSPGTLAAREGLAIIPSLVAPAAAPILIMVILFDALMSKVRASDSEGKERIIFKQIMFVELATVAIMLIIWFPYFIAIGK